MSCTGFSMARKRLMDIDCARALFWAETNRLCTTPSARPLVIEEAVWPRVSCLATRLNERLLDLQATGQAEIPRMIGQTLRLLNLPTSDAGDMERNQLPVASPLREPYAHHNLQYRDSLCVAGWTTATIPRLQGGTNLYNQELITSLVAGRGRFYRAVLARP